jgi:hypothetical protein
MKTSIKGWVIKFLAVWIHFSLGHQWILLCSPQTVKQFCWNLMQELFTDLLFIVSNVV